VEVVGLGGVDGVFVVVSCALGVAHLNMGLLAGVLHVWLLRLGQSVLRCDLV